MANEANAPNPPCVMADFIMRDFGPHGATGRVADHGKPARFAVIHLRDFMPRIVANPFGGNAYYAEREEAERVMEEVIRRKANGEII
jgi:hypothetical protein